MQIIDCWNNQFTTWGKSWIIDPRPLHYRWPQVWKLICRLIEGRYEHDDTIDVRCVLHHKAGIKIICTRR